MDLWPDNMARKHPDANSIRTAWGQLDLSSTVWGSRERHLTGHQAEGQSPILPASIYLTFKSLFLPEGSLSTNRALWEQQNCWFFTSRVTRILKCSGIWDINLLRLYLKSLSRLLRTLGRHRWSRSCPRIAPNDLWSYKRQRWPHPGLKVTSQRYNSATWQDGGDTSCYCLTRGHHTTPPN